MSQSPVPNPYGTPSTSGPRPIGRFQRVVNAVVRTLLRAPVLGPVVGRRLLILHVVGRKTGRVFDIPLAYTRHDGALLIGTAVRPWVRNLRPGTPVQVSMGGPRRTAEAEVFTDEAEVMRLFEIIARDNPRNAEYNGIGFASDGSPNKADIYQTWRAGGAVIRLTPR
ncbi:nitroreductase/quinone reductase family protein [Nocardia farcinica]|uniref:nitroreductase/quinone reductase family protein n=1 Tax=Nocardia farcinica TaxID=37329 RepID=UPI0018949D91|nr:nitroreductase/quinone reductase family protein [Nocardia farcinica]MBF6441866.1 nitroreductase family deazaflavin-dependent oxidoreductase [Nocardia farcinica]